MKLVPQTLHRNGQGIIIHIVSLRIPDLFQDSLSGYGPSFVLHQIQKKLVLGRTEVYLLFTAAGKRRGAVRSLRYMAENTHAVLVYRDIVTGQILLRYIAGPAL